MRDGDIDWCKGWTGEKVIGGSEFRGQSGEIWGWKRDGNDERCKRKKELEIVL